MPNKTTGYLKQVLLEELIRRVEEGVTSVDKDGNPVKADVSASDINAAINFLKLYPADDDVVATGDISPELRAYADKMKFKPGISAH